MAVRSVSQQASASGPVGIRCYYNCYLPLLDVLATVLAGQPHCDFRSFPVGRPVFHLTTRARAVRRCSSFKTSKKRIV